MALASRTFAPELKPKQYCRTCPSEVGRAAALQAGATPAGGDALAVIVPVFLALAGCAALLAGCGGGVNTPNAAPSSPATVSIAISPSASDVAPGHSQQFLATVTGTTNKAATWAVNTVAGGSAAAGTVSLAGLYVAPSNAPIGGTATVAARSAADSTKTASAIVTMHDSVTISPAAITVAAGDSQPFSASVNGTVGASVEWMVNGLTPGNANVGTISASGVYTAPATVPASVIAVTAVDTLDTGAIANAAVTVFDPALAQGHDLWLAGVADAAASYGCTDVSVQQRSAESLADVVKRFDLTATEGSCLVLWPISADPTSLRYSLAWGGVIGGKNILYIADTDQSRIWNGLAVAGN